MIASQPRVRQLDGALVVDTRHDRRESSRSLRIKGCARSVLLSCESRRAVARVRRPGQASEPPQRLEELDGRGPGLDIVQLQRHAGNRAVAAMLQRSTSLWYDHHRLLSPGARGEDVAEVQRALDLDETGVYDDDTEAAVREFKRRCVSSWTARSAPSRVSAGRRRRAL